MCFWNWQTDEARHHILARVHMPLGDSEAGGPGGDVGGWRSVRHHRHSVQLAIAMTTRAAITAPMPLALAQT